MQAVTDEERYHFDLKGFLILRGAIEKELVKALDDAVVANEAIDQDESWLEDIPEITLRTLIRGYGEKYQIKADYGNQIRLNGLQRLDPAFDSLVAHPSILSYLEAFMEDPQFINGWSISKYEGRGATGWHAGLRVEDYSVNNGIIHSPMVNVVTMLTPNHPGDGCFGVVPGSHKRNFTFDRERWGQAGLDSPGAVEITGDPGDVMIFSEALLHAGMAKTTKRRRTTLQYNHIDRFRVTLMADLQNVRHFWMPQEIRDRFTPAQKKLTDWMEIMPAPRS